MPRFGGYLKTLCSFFLAFLAGCFAGCKAIDEPESESWPADEPRDTASTDDDFEGESTPVNEEDARGVHDSGDRGSDRVEGPSWSRKCPEIAYDTNGLCSFSNGVPEPYEPITGRKVDPNFEYVDARRSNKVVLGQRFEKNGGKSFFVSVYAEQLCEEFQIDGNLNAVGVVTPFRQRFYPKSGFEWPEGVIGYAAVVLICEDSGCLLYGLSQNDEGALKSLEPIDNGRVPLPKAHGIAGIQIPDGYRMDEICVAGDGLACFDGVSWRVELAPGQGILRAIEAQGNISENVPYAAAAGDDGALWLLGSSGWEAVDTRGDIDLVSVSVWGRFFGAAGPDGMVLGDANGAVSCVYDHRHFSAVFVRSHVAQSRVHSQATLFTDDGRLIEVFETSGEFVGCEQDSKIAGRPIAAGFDPYAADVVLGYAISTRGLYRRVESSTGFYP